MNDLTASIAILDVGGMVVSANHAWQTFAGAKPSPPLPCPERGNYLDACAAGQGDNSLSARETACGIRAVLSGDRETFTLEFPCGTPSESRWFSLRLTRLPAEGQGRAVVSLEDVTDHKQAEQCRIAETDEFAYLVSHDLKAPLRGIANLSRWIEEDMDGQGNGAVREHLGMLRGRVARMDALIDGILRYSRAGRVHDKPVSTDVAVLLAEIIDALDPPPGFIIEIDPGMPTLAADRQRLRQVFLSLIDNALKHHPGPAKGHVNISVRDTDDFFEFLIADDGPGIAPAYHEKIFGIFQTLQAHDGLEGVGMGLSLAKKIVQTQGGTIGLESDLGHGSRFRFTWPKAPRRNSLDEETTSEIGMSIDVAENAEYSARGR